MTQSRPIYIKSTTTIRGTAHIFKLRYSVYLPSMPIAFSFNLSTLRFIWWKCESGGRKKERENYNRKNHFQLICQMRLFQRHRHPHSTHTNIHINIRMWNARAPPWVSQKQSKQLRKNLVNCFDFTFEII